MPLALPLRLALPLLLLLQLLLPQQLLLQLKHSLLPHLLLLLPLLHLLMILLHLLLLQLHLLLLLLLLLMFALLLMLLLLRELLGTAVGGDSLGLHGRKHLRRHVTLLLVHVGDHVILLARGRRTHHAVMLVLGLG